MLVDRLLEEMEAPGATAAQLRTPTFLRCLARHAWPGNIRELRNHLERCLVISEGELPGLTATTDPLAIDPSRTLKANRDAWTRAFERRYLQA